MHETGSASPAESDYYSNKWKYELKMFQHATNGRCWCWCPSTRSHSPTVVDKRRRRRVETGAGGWMEKFHRKTSGTIKHLRSGKVWDIASNAIHRTIIFVMTIFHARTPKASRSCLYFRAETIIVRWVVASSFNVVIVRLRESPQFRPNQWLLMDGTIL